MTIQVKDAIREFLLACEADGLKPASSRWYEAMLRPLSVRFAGEQVNGIQVGAMRQYVVDLRNRNVRYQNTPHRRPVSGPLSIETLRGHIRALRRFWNWCEAEYELEPTANPMRRIRMPAKPKQMPKAIDPEDLRKLFDATGSETAGARDRAILAFLADTGCRAAGILGLTPDRLEIDAGRAIVFEKFDRARAVPFSPFTANLLNAWLSVRPAKAQTVFCSLAAGHYGEALTLSGLHSILRRLRAKSDVKGRINPHSFRHGFARTYLQNGGDLATLSQILGHSDVSVTVANYAVFDSQELAAQHGKFSPFRDWEADNEEAKFKRR